MIIIIGLSIARNVILKLFFVYFILTCLNISTGQFTRCAKMDSDEFTLFDRAQLLLHPSTLWNSCWHFPIKCHKMYTYKARGVVIPHGLGITIGLQQGIRCNNLILQ